MAEGRVTIHVEALRVAGEGLRRNVRNDAVDASAETDRQREAVSGEAGLATRQSAGAGVDISTAPAASSPFDRWRQAAADYRAS